MQPLHSVDTGEDAVISELYQQHAPALLTHLRANMPSAQDAEDLLLDVFVAALERQSLRALSMEEQRYWLWRVARNKLVDYYRKRSRRQHVPLEDVSETAFEDDELAPELSALRNEEHRDLRAAIKRLPALQQEILLLRFVNGLRSPEIASILKKQETAVRMILSRTLNKLRDSYQKRQG
jgi:RNA polymerase sigma factor (sigma-70 family)